MPGWEFRARRMIRGMGHMLFPRYIQREARDFFYLTSRPLLPGATLAGAEGPWRTQGLPQHGFPYAVATASVRADSGQHVRVVRVDPRTMQPAADTSPDTVLAVEPGARGPLSLWSSGGAFAIAAEPPRPDATRLASGFPPLAAQAAVSRSAAGVQDDDGMLVWVELSPQDRADAQTAAAMDSVLQRLGCSGRVAFAGSPRILLGGSLDATGAPAAPASPTAIRFERVPGPDAHTMFADTPLVPIQVWRPLQAKRVRYFYKPKPSASASASAGTEPPPIRVQSRP
jgi:hypothetical protein